MIACTENCKYQKNGECTYDFVSSNTVLSKNSTCAYFDNKNS